MRLTKTADEQATKKLFDKARDNYTQAASLMLDLSLSSKKGEIKVFEYKEIAREMIEKGERLEFKSGEERKVVDSDLA